MQRNKKKIRKIFMLIGVLGMILMIFVLYYHRLSNPDMASTRFAMNFWKEEVLTVIFLNVYCIGKYWIKR